MTQDTKTPNPFANNMFNGFLENAPNAAQELIDIQKRNIESFSQAQHIAIDKMQEIAQRQRDVFSQIMAQGSTVTNDIMSGGKPEEQLNRNTQVFQDSFEQMVENTKEISDLIKNANQETTSILKKRAGESIKEVQICMKNKANTQK